VTDLLRYTLIVTSHSRHYSSITASMYAHVFNMLNDLHQRQTIIMTYDYDRQMAN